MQTFLPYPDFQKSASVLDNKRLGKQRVECLQILKTLSKENKFCHFCKKQYSQCVGNQCTVAFHKTHTFASTPWYNHPAVKMWRGYEKVLYHCYLAAIVNEWFIRGYKDTCYEKARLVVKDTQWLWQNLMMPPWLTDSFCASHRSNLLRKDPIYYGQFGWTEPNNLPYVWPI